MTIEEAIKRLEIIATNLCGQPAQNPNLWPDYKAVDMALSAIRQQEHFRDLTKKMEPLTLDELRKMDGEPVWVQSPGVPEYGRWAIVEGVGENCLFLHDDFTCHDYGKTWLAYRSKKEV